MDQYNAIKYGGPNHDKPIVKRSSTQREGWFASAFLERMYDWGNPGIFGWYSSGDSGDPSNGSQRMPVVLGYGNYTSMMGDGNRHTWRYRDINSTYTGTWGIGAQIRELRSFSIILIIP